MTINNCTCQICETKMIADAERRGDMVWGMLFIVAVLGVWVVVCMAVA